MTSRDFESAYIADCVRDTKSGPRLETRHKPKEKIETCFTTTHQIRLILNIQPA